MPTPALVAHADWSSSEGGRWVARAVRTAEGGYVALAPEPVGALADFLARQAAAAGPGGTAFLGFDFPIGLPAGYAAAAGIDRFKPALSRFGRARWKRFYEPAETPEQIAATRPFYPARPGGARHEHLTRALGAPGISALRRACDGRTRRRLAASPLFWTLGGQQVGKAAISGWRDLLGPARRGGIELRLWPFDGALADLLATPGLVAAETYPAEIYVHLGLGIGAVSRSKRRQADRRAEAAALLRWAWENKVHLSAALAAEIRDGFGVRPNGEDRFDATVGLFGMLNVVLGHRPAFDPRDAARREIEGWVLGLDPDDLFGD